MPKAESSIFLQAVGRRQKGSHGSTARRADLRRDAREGGCVNNSNSTARSAFAFAADFFEQLDLDLLNLKEAVVLTPQQVIDFFVQVPDLELGFEVDFVIDRAVRRDFDSS